jgi:uncharacterized protein (UPF0332 family)
LSKTLFNISENINFKDTMGLTQKTTFYDWVIVSSYYSIFHSVHALLGMKQIKINSRLHHATLISFAYYFIESKELEDELFTIYKDAEKKAKGLLEIYEEEKEKRGIFQYHRLSKYNSEPAKESIENAVIFLNVVGKVLAKNNLL